MPAPAAVRVLRSYRIRPLTSALRETQPRRRARQTVDPPRGPQGLIADISHKTDVGGVALDINPSGVGRPGGDDGVGR